MSDRMIAHMDLDSFFVSVERLLNSELNNRPVLIGGTGDRGVVASCSYEARAFGVRSAMPMRQARMLCPEAVVIRGNSMTYMKYSDLVTDIIEQRSPLFEKASVDEFYIDFTGMDQFFGTMQYVTELRQEIMRETGLPISFGLSENKTVSKIATGEAKPNNKMRIQRGKEKPFLAPLSVGKIPMVGPQTFQTLCNLGVKRIAVLQQMPVDLVEKVLGKNGKSIWKKAQGIDYTPVQPHTEQKSISTERTFEKDTIDVNRLKSLIIAMTENLAFQLRRGNKLTACIALKLRYTDFQTKSIQATVPHTAADHILIAKVLELFEKLYTRRVMIRLVGVRFSKLAEGGYQMNLFDDSTQMTNLYQAMDKVRERFGSKAVQRAVTKDVRTIGRPNPFNGSAPLLLANRRQ